MFQENSKKCKKCRTYEVTLNKNVLRKKQKMQKCITPEVTINKNVSSSEFRKLEC